MTTPFSRRLTAAFLASLAVAVTVFAATVFALYLVNSLSLNAVGTYANTFALPALVLLVVLMIAGLIDAFGSWWGALLAGLV
ncbi:MAG: hypothetical protein FWF16_05415, partial [Microbacteriaceae bacterium]|nr:hypothetical protein [Microbacteriaceae bacterium]